MTAHDDGNARSPLAAARTSGDRVLFGAAAVALLLAAGIALHLRPLNGPSYFPWPWTTGLPWPRLLGVAALAGGALGAIAVAIRIAERGFTAGLTVLAIAGLALRLGASALGSQPIGLANAAALSRDPYVGSFYTVARALADQPWTLADFPSLMASFPLHAVNKPPGPVLLWSAMLRLAGGDEATALRLGVLLIGAISAAAVPLTAVAARGLSASRVAATHAASVLLLMPGLTVFFPMLDPAYVTWTLLGTILWTAAIRRSAWLAVPFGAWLAGTLFLAFGVLPISLYLAAIGLWLAVDATPSKRAGLARFVVRSAMAGAAALVCVVAMQLASGYDAVETFRVALEQQRTLLGAFGATLRPYPRTIGWDLYDAALGVGFAPATVCLATLVRRRTPDFDERCHAPFALAAIGLGVWIVVAVAGLLPGETARVWAFLFPPLAVPAGWRLARASPRAAAACYVAMAVVLVVIVRSMVFLTIAPVIAAPAR